MMQNLPFLVTQNAATPKAGNVSKSQKTSDVGSSFKQVLSKQTEHESAKDASAKPSVVKADKSQKIEASEAPASSHPAHVKTPNDLIAETELKDAAIADVELLNKNGVVPLAQKPVKDSPEQLQPVETADDKVQASTEEAKEANAALVAALQLPMLNNQPVQSVVAKTTAVENATPIETTRPSSVPAIDQKNLLSTEKEANDNQEINSPPIEVAGSNRGFSELPPKGSKLSENAERFNTILAPKLTQETPAMPQPSVISLAASSALTQGTMAQMQAGNVNTIAVYPGKAGWDQAISQKVVWMVGAAEQTATLTLNPPDLGPLQVVVSVNNDKADTTFISENPEVRKALESGIPALRNLMDQAGIELGQTSVGTGKQQQEFQQAARERLASQLPANTSPQAIEKETIKPIVRRMNNGLVDTFA